MVSAFLGLIWPVLGALILELLYLLLVQLSCCSSGKPRMGCPFVLAERRPPGVEDELRPWLNEAQP